VEALLTPYAEINRAGSPKRKHIGWCDVLEEYCFLFEREGFEPETFFKFGVLREPFDWVLSWFNYRVGNDKIEQPLPASMTFDEFWKSDDWVKNLTQKHHFVDKNGKIALDLIIPQDEFSEGFSGVLKVLGIDDLDVSRENKSSGKLKRENISGALVDSINHHYKDDSELYWEWKIKYKEVLSDPHVGRRVSVAGKDCLHVSVDDLWAESKKVDYAQVDTFKEADSRDNGVIIGGVVVLNKQMNDKTTLVLEHQGVTETIQWGISSPWVAREYPKSPNSANARFKFQYLPEKNESARIVLKDSNRNNHVLFKIAMGNQ